MSIPANIETALIRHQGEYKPVIQFDPSKDKLLLLDFTNKNTDLTEEIFIDTEKFSSYINHKLTDSNSLYGIGGYNEHRSLYSRSEHFHASGEPRRLHLGIDIWGKVNTPVFTPLGSIVHSYAFNNNHGDYGATIILQHQLDAIVFYTLYGHVSLQDIFNLKQGDYLSAGTKFAHLGDVNENGNWPPHLHFQVIIDMQGMKGDYPGVCKFTEREKYLENSPDPDLILQMTRYTFTQ